MPDDQRDDDLPAVGEGDLLTVLDVIEQQPLDTRAAGYEAVHAELGRRLDGGSRAQPGASREDA